jgi:hypothetical protein
MADERRQGRANEVAAERRRRGDSEFRGNKRLPIPPKVEAELKAQGRVPRWVNDEGNRMYQLTVQDDYDKVEGVDPVPIGTGVDGKPILAHLLSKRKDFIEEDRAKADAKRRDTEASLLRGQVPDAGGSNERPSPTGSQSYVDKASSITTNRILE